MAHDFRRIAGQVFVDQFLDRGVLPEPTVLGHVDGERLHRDGEPWFGQPGTSGSRAIIRRFGTEKARIST